MSKDGKYCKPHKDCTERELGFPCWRKTEGGGSGSRGDLECDNYSKQEKSVCAIVIFVQLLYVVVNIL